MNHFNPAMTFYAEFKSNVAGHLMFLAMKPSPSTILRRYFNSDSYGGGGSVDRYGLVCTMLRVVYVDETKCKEILKDALVSQP